MRGLDEIERDAKSLRSRAKAQDDAGLLQMLSSGFPQARIPGLEALAKELLDSLSAKYATPDWRTLWRGRAAATASVLGDCFGMRGGALRRARDLDGAIAAYDQGFTYESEAEFGIKANYNRVQRLTVRIINTRQNLRSSDDLRTIVVPMIDPILAHLRGQAGGSSDQRESTVLEQLREAEQAIDAIIQSTKSEERDVWQEADLALVRLLLGDDRPNNELWGKIPRTHTKVFESTKKVIDDLKTKFQPSEPNALRARFEDTSNYFTEILSFA